MYTLHVFPLYLVFFPAAFLRVFRPVHFPGDGGSVNCSSERPQTVPLAWEITLTPDCCFECNRHHGCGPFFVA